MSNQSGFDLFLLLRNKLKMFVSTIAPPDEVEDIVQDTYVKVWQQHNKEDKDLNHGFLFTVAKNTTIDYFRKASTKYNEEFVEEKVLDENDVGSNDCSVHRAVVSNERFALFCEAVQGMAPQCRKVFVLRKVYGMTTKEIAKELEISPRTVETQLHRAYIKFQAHVNPVEETDATEEAALQEVNEK